MQPLSKLVQDSIQHFIPKLEHKARDTKHIHQIISQLIIDALTICLEENFCEFCGQYYQVNHGTAMDPAHSCDYSDIFVGLLKSTNQHCIVTRTVIR